jgi:predicted RNase H-like HicB family nuclease
MRTQETRLTPVYEEVVSGWVAGRILEIPAIATAGRTREETERMLRNELREYLRSLREEGRPPPDGVPPGARI